MRIPEQAAVPRRVRALGLAAAYAAVALLATAFFFFLHDLGNRLPRELAQQRFRAEFEAGRPDEGQARGYKTDYEYCEMSETVLAGARGGWRSPRAEEGRAFFNAVVLSTFATVPGKDYCHELRAAVNGAEVGDEIPPGYIRSRYWWGSKALYAIALRYLSVREFREFTLASTRVAYLLLTVSLLLLAPRTLPAAAPLLAFGAFSSGVEYWADVANGLPYLWAVASAAILVWLMRVRRSSGVFSGAVPVWCFTAGTVSSYLWLGDGHTFLALTWIGLLVWFGHDAPNVAERTRRAASCIGLYCAGFLACYGLGLAVKADIRGYEATWLDLWKTILATFDRSADEVSTTGLSTYHDSFYATYWPSWLPADVYPTTVAVSAAAAAVGIAVHRARRGRLDPLWGLLWIAGLMAINAVSFVVTEHIHYRTARFVFVPLGLCWSGLALSVRSTNWRFRSAALGVVLVVAGAVSSYSIRADRREIDALLASVGDMRPVISSRFDVYLDDVGNRLVYVNEECSDEDVAAWFFVHVWAFDEADLPDRARRHGWDHLDFVFGPSGFRADGRCAAVRALPEYELARVSTGQAMLGREPEWSGFVRWANDRSVFVVDPRPFDELIASVEGLRPVVSSVFDVYLDGNTLVYVKEECGDEDVDALFFLHLFAAADADLPDGLEVSGFENLDFAFRTLGRRGGRGCAVARVLPEYRIASLHTGQYLPGQDPEWSERVGIADAQVMEDLIAGVEDARPVVSGGFDVYLDEDRLVYVKEECGGEDVGARFFLHLYPVDAADLPDRRKPHGYDNLDFTLDTHGHRFGGRCAAARALPEYEIASIRTGRYTPGLDPAWSGRVGLSAPWSAVDSREVEELFAGVEDRQPVVSGGFDVHLDGNRLVYVKEECGDEDVDARFFLHFYPVDAADLPDRSKPHGFDNLDFAFERYGLRGGGRCAAVRVLPEYEIASVRTGQYTPGQDPEWSGRVSSSVLRSAAAAADSRDIDELIAGVEDAPPVVSGGFDVYLDEDRLVYVKEDCGAEDVGVLFFLHLYPVYEADLPDPRRPHGFDNLDFAFERYGLRGGGRCAAVRVLPEYEIASVHTGQYAPGQDPAWSGNVSFPVSWSFATARAIDDLIAGVEDARPVVSGGFDVYLDGNRLVYVKEDCGAEDVGARFFLHLYPVDEAALPDPRRPHGFDNLDFAFEAHGRRAGGRCAAVRLLPGYELASVRTGRYAPGQDPAWSGNVSFPVSWSFATARATDDLIAGVEDARPVISGVFDVYLDGNRLVYVKEDCGAEDVDADFFLHLYPVDEAALPDPRRPHGFDNLDFAFEAHGRRAGGRCAAVRVLPDYEIASIGTGQFVPGQDPAWSGSVNLAARSQ